MDQCTKYRESIKRLVLTQAGTHVAIYLTTDFMNMDMHYIFHPILT
jgi:hypothetical protein